MKKRCALYRHFDARGRLLYVGISLNALSRLAEHSVNAKWYPNIVSVTLDHYPTVMEARAAERFAIVHEMPLHNVCHSGRLNYRMPLPNGGLLTVQDIL
jgi:hypothetical protein